MTYSDLSTDLYAYHYLYIWDLPTFLQNLWRLCSPMEVSTIFLMICSFILARLVDCDKLHPCSRKVLQICTGPVVILSAQAGIRLDPANPAIVNEAVFKNPLREPLAIECFPFRAPLKCHSEFNQTPYLPFSRVKWRRAACSRDESANPIRRNQPYAVCKKRRTGRMGRLAIRVQNQGLGSWRYA